MRVLVFGSRTYGRPVRPDRSRGDEQPDLGLVFDVLQGMYEMHSLGYLLTHMQHFTVVHGMARGADTLAKMWVEAVGPHPGDQRGVNDDVCSVLQDPYPADWQKHGNAAGPIRNQRMLVEGKPTVGVGFVDKPLVESLGSHDMAHRLKRAEVPVYVVEAK